MIAQYCALVLSMLGCLLSFSSAFPDGVCFRQTDRNTYKVSCTCFGIEATWQTCTATSNELKVEPNGEVCFEYSDNERNPIGCRCPHKGITLYSDYKATTVSLQQRPSGGVCFAFFNDIRDRMECNCEMEGLNLNKLKKSTMEVISGAPQRTGYLPGEVMQNGRPTGLCFRQKDPNNGKETCTCYGIAASESTCGLDIMELLIIPPGGVCFEETNYITQKSECICPLFAISFDSCVQTSLTIGEPIPPPRPTRGPTVPSITVKGRPTFKVENTQCIPNPCKHRGTCIAVPNTENFHCRCRERYHGKLCEKSETLLPVSLRNPCLPNPCRNQGTCSRMIGTQKHTCKCRRGYGGLKCEKTIATSQVFANERYIVTRHGKGNRCFPNPCQNSGVCYRRGTRARGYSKPFCKCEKGFAGEYCEYRDNLSDQCRPNPCKNRGVCVKKAKGKFVCRCKNKFRGKTCRIRPKVCFPNTCPRNQLCVPFKTSHLCISTLPFQTFGN